MTLQRTWPWLVWLLLPGADSPASPQAQTQEESIYLEKVDRDFLERVKKCEQARDWKGLFEHYAYSLKKHSQSVVQISPDRWTSVHEYFLRRITALPKEALEYYRFQNDGKARAAFDKARDSGSRREVERVVEEYFFATGTDEVMDGLASQDFDEGRVEEARSWWNRLLRLYPDTRISRAVLAARIAHACLVSENAGGLADLRRFLEKEKIEGAVSVGGRSLPLAEYLAPLSIPGRPLAVRPAKMPYVPDPEERLRRPTLGVRNDIRRWVYDFTEDRGETGAAPEPEPPRAVLGRPAFRARPFRGDMQAPPPYPEYPLVPAYAKVRGKDYVIFTDGSRVLAVDPARVKGKSATSGVYWKYPSDKAIVRAQAAGAGVTGRPYVGVTIDGEYAFVTMYSSPDARQRDANPAGNPDGFEGVTAVKCLHIPTGKLVWDTDLPPLIDEIKTTCKDYFERNFSYAAAPLVRGDRIYLGVCTSPMGEQESRVVCLDRKSGRPQWSTFLSSVTAQQAAFMGMAYQPAYLPMLAEQGGTLYVQTNLGVVGALNPANGAVLWLAQYKRAGRRYQPNTGTTEAAFRRPANAPILWNGLLFVLAQDRADLLAFEASTGDEIKLPAGGDIHGDLDWKSILHLLGPVNDELVVTGSDRSFQLKLRDENGPCYRGNYLIASACRGAGRGVVTEDYVYLPVMDGNDSQTGGLGVYDVRTWKVVERPPWKEPNEGGNLLVAGNYLVVATNRIAVYTDVDTLRNQYARRLGQSPQNPELLLEYGETMRENERLEEAAEAYLSFIRAVDGDPRQADKAREVRRELHTIFIRRGEEAQKRSGEAATRLAEAVRRVQEGAKLADEAVKKGDDNGKLLAEASVRTAEADQRKEDASRKSESEKALECFRFAKEFAWDRDSEAEAVERLAGTYEGLGLWREAVGQYQELILKGRTLFHRESENVTKLWDHAARRIDDIVAKVPGAYADVEQQAADALQKVKDGSVEGLRDVMDHFPNSKAARDAFGKMRDTLLKQGQLDKLRALYGDFQDRFKLKLNFDAYKELLELLNKLGDLDRLKFELAHFAERFPDRTVQTDGREEPVKEYVARRLEELSRAPHPPAPLQGPLRLLGELEAVQLSSDPQGVATGHQPLCPLGTEPAALGSDRELFRRGSCVELWDLKTKTRIWSCAHPGGWLGAVYGEAPQGVTVLFVKPGSPAEKAGLRKDDVMLSIDGQPLRASGAGDLFSSLGPRSAVELACRRGGTDLRLRATLSAMPAELRPAIIGASFTREGALAVAWEDELASIDLATGEPQWTFRVSRDRFLFSGFHATEGRLYLYESIRGDRLADPMRLPTPGVPLTFKVQEAHHLLFCLSDFTGEVLWARKFDFDPANPFQDTRVEFLGRYFADHVAFLHMMSRGGIVEWSLWMMPAQSGAKSETGALREPQRRPLHGQLLAHAADTDGTVLYYVADVPERRERTLHSLSLDPAQQGFKPVEIRLNDVKYMPYQFNYTTCSLAASRGYLTLVVSPSQQNIEHRIWTWRTSDLKDRSLPLLPGRTLPVARPAGMGIGPDDILYVYNVPRDRSPAQAVGRAYVTAFRLNSPPEADPVLWDAKAPSINDMAGAAMIHGVGNFEVFGAPRASQPGEVAEYPTVVVYDRQAEGYVKLDRMDLVQPSENPGELRLSVVAWRGRIYLLGQKSVEIWGD